VGKWLSATDRVKVLRPTRHRIGHFGDVLSGMSKIMVIMNVEKETIDRLVSFHTDFRNNWNNFGDDRAGCFTVTSCQISGF